MGSSHVPCNTVKCSRKTLRNTLGSTGFSELFLTLPWTAPVPALEVSAWGGDGDGDLHNESSDPVYDDRAYLDIPLLGS